MLTARVVTKATDVTFKVSAPQAVVMGEQFRLTFTIDAEGKGLRVQETPDFDVLMGSSQSTFYGSSWMSGKSTSETTVTYTYVLMSEKEDTFSVTPATIKVNGFNYTLNSLTIKVLPADKAGKQEAETTTVGGAISNDRLLMKMDTFKQSVLEQEGSLATFKAYSLENFSITGLKYPEFEGFLIQEVELLQEEQLTSENYNGRNYQSAVMRQIILYPRRSGKATIEGGKYGAMVRVRMRQAGGSNIFGSFFDSYRGVSKVLATSPATIDMKPLPSGEPAFFSGAVGTFSVTIDINSNNVKIDETVTIRVRITGNGNVKLVRNPEAAFLNDLNVYDPKVEMGIRATTAGVSGSKTIEYMAIFRYAGDFEIPAIAFSYFDIKSGLYKTIKSEPYKLYIEQGKGGSGSFPVVSNFSNKENVRYLGRGIRYLKMRGSSFTEGGNGMFFGSFIYYPCYIVPAILFIVFFFIYRKQVKENADIALVRTKKVSKMAARRPKNAGKLMKENKEEKFYDEVLHTLWGYLSDKLSILQSDLTENNVEIRLVKYGVDKSLTNEFIDTLNACEFVRYVLS